MQHNHVAAAPSLRLLLQLAVASALAAGALADGPPGFTVTGRVYCDNCRAGFETNVSHSIKGATVQMECRHFETQEVKHRAEAAANEWGWYKMEVGGEHEAEICEVALVRSPEAECAEIERFRDRSRVPLTRNNGIKQDGFRYANPIAFFRKDPLPACGDILRSYDLYDDDSENGD
ncbi:major pollen allergen Lol p 11-like [Oryza brachyantha]|uniref:major pollen allergen Lol p 11-like n=1 Tax=Oryza brachyantha TaxID=4533 RepID=UPI001ADBC328|nr:major pollen allergen Lol p 11-like [Oryza brachyantha]